MSPPATIRPRRCRLWPTFGRRRWDDVTADGQGRIYSDSGGWSIVVPPGWHVVPFSEVHDGIITAGAQLSNTPLPPPSVIPGTRSRCGFCPRTASACPSPPTPIPPRLLSRSRCCPSSSRTVTRSGSRTQSSRRSGREDHAAVLVGAVGTPKLVGDRPDETPERAHKAPHRNRSTCMVTLACWGCRDPAKQHASAGGAP